MRSFNTYYPAFCGVFCYCAQNFVLLRMLFRTVTIRGMTTEVFATKNATKNATNNPTFAALTTVGVGGVIDRFVEPTSRVAVIEAVEDADEAHLPLCVIGGGSNMLVSDAPFHGVVVRDARRTISVLDEASPAEDGVDEQTGAHVVHVNAEAGCNWDDFVAHVIELGLEGVEGLSGIPGTVGASVVQNIGAYGQEVSQSVTSVEVWDRENKVTLELQKDQLRFGYRTSLLKQSMYTAVGVPSSSYFPTPRYVVLSVNFCLRHHRTGVVSHAQLAKALHVALGERMETVAIRREVLRVRASKGMLEDASRYDSDWMRSAKSAEGVAYALRLQQEDYVAGAWHDGDDMYSDRHSCGSFFMNPIMEPGKAALLPEDAPRFEALLPDGSQGVKTSAAWLIDHAGFHKGFRIVQQGVASAAGLSSLHTLALTNRNHASADDILNLAKTIIDGVYSCFGVRLVPEPVLIGLSVD